LGAAEPPYKVHWRNLSAWAHSGVVTLSDIGQRWTIDQQAKPLKYRMSKSALVGKFQSIGLNVTMPLAGMVHAKHQVTTQIRIDALPLARFGK